MELKACCILILPFILQGSVKGELASSDGDCRECKPGYYVYRKCSVSHDTICAPCSEGSFSSVSNINEKCSPCSSCGLDFFELKRCSATQDAFCESCASNRGVDSVSYKRTCLLGDSYQIQHGEGDLKVVTNETDNLEEGSGHTDIDQSDLKNNVIPKSKSEDGRVMKLSKFNNTGLILDNTSGGVEDGSGDIALSGMDQFKKSSPPPLYVTVLPEDAEEEELLPVHTKIVTTTLRTVYDVESTTVTDTDVTEGSGSGIVVEVGKGLVISVDGTPYNPDLHGVPSTYNIGNEQKETRKNLIPHLNSSDVVEPSVGASTDEHNNETSKVTIGVVIAVALLGGIGFFALGFVLSRKCKRRRRSIKMKALTKEDVEGKNGNVGGAGYHGANLPDYVPDIYDEIDQEPERKVKKQPNGIHQENPENDLYAIPIKKDTAPVLTCLPQTANADDFANLEELRYIDETDDEAEDTSPTECLLNSSDSPSDTPAVEIESEHSGNSPNSFREEKTPMLSNVYT